MPGPAPQMNQTGSSSLPDWPGSNPPATDGLDELDFPGQALGNSACENSFELVMLALSLPLWTFGTLFVIVILIQYLRQLQYFTVYDKCTGRNAHFRYDFHIVCGRHSHNYSRNEYLILDLLDNHSISTTTIQLPGSTVFNDHQMFMYRHARPNLRCVQFSVYRRHPIKDVKSIRIAHSCSNPDSRLYIYGLDIYDDTNSETKFVPVMSVVKYRGTHWALNTSFEPKPDLNFKKLGVECHDPFSHQPWPTYFEGLTILLFIWCASFFFGHLIEVRSIAGSIPLHMLTIAVIVAAAAALISGLYLGFVKRHIISGHFDSSSWSAMQQLSLVLVIAVSIGFWVLALGQSKACRRDSYLWLISTCACSAALTLALILGWFIAAYRRTLIDSQLLAQTDANLARTNSKEGIQFLNDPVVGLCAGFQTNQESSTSKRAIEQHRSAPASAKATTPKPVAQPTDQKQQKGSVGKKPKTVDERPVESSKKTEDNETLDTAFNHGSKHMKVKNRNSISQYV